MINQLTNHPFQENFQNPPIVVNQNRVYAFPVYVPMDNLNEALRGRGSKSLQNKKVGKAVDSLLQQGKVFKDCIEFWVQNGGDPKYKYKRKRAGERIIDIYNFTYGIGNKAVEKPETLNLSCLHLTSLPECIGELTHLVELNLSRNCLVDLPQSLQNLKKLETLDLSENGFSIFPSVVCEINNLRTLEMTRNQQLTELPEYIRHLEKLQSVNLCGNNLKTIPYSIEHLKNLKKINLSFNRLEWLPNTLSKLHNLEELCVQGNQIFYLPETIGGLIELQTLNLNSNNLKELPKGICKLKKLNNLEVYKNEIESLPEELGDLENLTNLVLDENKLISLPTSIGKLKNLTKISVRQNQLTGLPDGFGSLSNLSVANLKDNQIEKLPNTLWGLVKLNNLILCNNLLADLPASIGALINLKRFQCKNNRLSSLPYEFRFLSFLETLALTENKFSVFPESVCSLFNLVTLELDKNKIERIPSSIGSLNLLRQLFLNGNKISHIPREISLLRNLQTINFVSNRNLVDLGEFLIDCEALSVLNVSIQLRPQANLILSRIRERRNKKENCSLLNRLTQWKTASEKHYDFNFIFNQEIFNEEKQRLLYEWLFRLEKTKEIRNERKQLSVLVCNILNTLKSNEFRDTFFALLEGNLVDCGDRSSLLLNIIYTHWQLNNLSETFDVTDRKKIEIIRGVAKTITLRNAVDSMIDQYNVKEKRKNPQFGGFAEDVEVRLYYELALKERLGLKTALNHMLYEEMGKRTDIIDEQELIEMVRNNYEETFYNFSALESYLNKHPFYGKMYQEKKIVIEKKFQLEQEKIQFFLDVANLQKEERDSNIPAKRQKIDYSIQIQELKDDLSLELQQIPNIENNPVITRYQLVEEYNFDCGKIQQELHTAIRGLRKEIVEKIEFFNN